MRKIIIFLTAVLVVCLSIIQPAHAQVTSRDDMVDKAYETTTIILETNQQQDPGCLNNNLHHPAYYVSPCDGSAPEECYDSELYCVWGIDEPIGWFGIFYGFGSGFSDPSTDLSVLQDQINDCRGIGSHWCHYNGNGCGYPGCTQFSGLDCSGNVSWCWGVPYTGTSNLYTHATLISNWDNIRVGVALVKAGAHTVMVTDMSPTEFEIVESCDDNPVAWARWVDPFDYSSSDYIAYDSKHVVDNQASDGFLHANLESSGDVEMNWKVARSRDVKEYWFQYAVLTTPAASPKELNWVSFEFQEHVGNGVYTATYQAQWAGTGEGLVFRVQEIDTRGAKIPYGEQKPRRITP